MKDKKHQKGCLTCFCNGLSVDCESSNLFYNQLTSDFEKEYKDWHISNKFTTFKEEVNYGENNQITFDKFDNFKNEELFFIIPEKFKGDKVD